jgi:dolichyl-phosphate beta-glucosyltransferase
MLRSLRLTRIRDTQCGFKLFPGNLARDLARVQRVEGFAYDVELLLLAEHWGYEVREIGVRWNHMEASRVMAVRHSMQMFRDMVRLWLWRHAHRLPDRPGSHS